MNGITSRPAFDPAASDMQEVTRDMRQMSTRGQRQTCILPRMFLDLFGCCAWHSLDNNAVPSARLKRTHIRRWHAEYAVRRTRVSKVSIMPSQATRRGGDVA